MSMQALSFIKTARVTGPQKTILFALADHAGPTGECRLLVSTLMAETCLSRTAVLENLDKLSKLGIIEKGPLTGRSRTYRLKMDAHTETTAETAPAEAPAIAPVQDLSAPVTAELRGTPNGPQRYAKRTSEVQETDLEPNRNPVSNPKGAASAKSKPITDPYSLPLPDCVPLPLWREWIAYRRERRLSCSPTTLSKQLEFLADLNRQGHPPRTVIENSIRNGWQGLFQPKATPAAPIVPAVRRAARKVVS